MTTEAYFKCYVVIHFPIESSNVPVPELILAVRLALCCLGIYSEQKLSLGHRISFAGSSYVYFIAHTYTNAHNISVKLRPLLVIIYENVGTGTRTQFPHQDVSSRKDL